MSPSSLSRHPFSRAAGLLAVLCVLAGCVYRPDIQQGNFLEVKDVDQVTTGMTRSQVRYLLGTPMISDPFEAQRWDYIYTLKHIITARSIAALRRVLPRTITKVDKLDLPDTTSVRQSPDRAGSARPRVSRRRSSSARRSRTPAPGGERY
jgi:outer membrane protein assembly factor BamE (lipoprotein component of BamABCDE complex)